MPIRTRSGGRRSGDEDGTGSLVDDLRRNRAKQRFFDRPMPAGAKDDQVGPDLPRRVDDDRGGTAFDQSRRDVQPEPAQGSCRLLEQRRAVGPHAVARLVRGDVGDARGPGSAEPLGLGREDRQDLHSAPDGQARLAARSSPNANSVDPSIASNAFIRDSFGASVARVALARMCQSDGPDRSVGPRDVTPVIVSSGRLRRRVGGLAQGNATSGPARRDLRTSFSDVCRCQLQT